jgi:hypothetical protein
MQKLLYTINSVVKVRTARNMAPLNPNSTSTALPLLKRPFRHSARLASTGAGGKPGSATERSRSPKAGLAATVRQYSLSSRPQTPVKGSPFKRVLGTLQRVEVF